MEPTGAVLRNATALMQRASCRTLSLAIAAAIATVAVSVPPPAFAETRGEPSDNSTDKGEFSFTFGAEYSRSTPSGGTRTEAKWSPLVDLQYTRGRFFASLSGVGYNVIDADGVTAGLGLGWESGRKEKDEVRLRGMGNVPSSGIVQLNGGLELLDGLVTIEGSADLATVRANGSTYLLGATVGYPFMDQKLIAFLTLSAEYADQRRMQTYYGVTAAQSARSGYRVFTPRAGWVSNTVSLGAAYEIAKRWNLVGQIGTTRLMNDAARSPLQTRRNEPSVSIEAIYRF
jgi:MipA family protein